MKRLLVIFSALLLIIVPQLKVKAAPLPSILAEGAILMDSNTGQILYEKNSNVKYEPASTTKIMTALITLEKANLSDRVTVGKKPPFEDGSKIYLLEGEELTVEQLLNALLIESANDAALALAEHISGSKEEFSKLMNEKAKALGCQNTNFANPNGLPEDNHYTTAHDLALISIEAMKNPTFRKIVATKSYQIQPTNKQTEIRYLHNHNKLLTSTKFKYEAADGIKTGYTGSARYTFVGSATKDGHQVVAVLLKSESQTYYYQDVATLFDYGFNNFSYKKILTADEKISAINVKGLSDEIPVFLSEDVYYTAENNKELILKKEITFNETISKINKGDTVGYLNINIDENFTKKIPLIAGDQYDSSVYVLKSLENGSYDRKLKSSVKYMSAGSIFGFFITSGFAIKYSKKRRDRRRNAYKNSKLF